jgi:methylenetetrahydrofolate dehydrogenase (NADP+)/methenyltetrahydrofolate cyclohydrolase
MIVDGKAIAADIRTRIREAVAKLPRRPELSLLIVRNDPATETFVRMKTRAAEGVGIAIRIRRFSQDAKETDVREAITAESKDDAVDGIVLQLPLPESMDVDRLTSLIPIGKDVDVLSRDAMAKFREGTLSILPPVAGAVQEILKRNDVRVEGADALVVGHGRLVGAPAALLLRHMGAHVTVVDRPVAALESMTKDARIIVSGAGVPNLLRPEMLRDGVVLIDAGTSESGGTIVGDASPECVARASVFTPVPGGVGPITVAMLLRNCYLVSRERQHALVTQ